MKNSDTEKKALESGPDPRAVETVRNVFNCLSKLILGKKIYAKNNPTLIRFSEEFDESLKAFFSTEDELVVAVDKYEFRWEDEIVYENNKRDESIAFLLYKDGVGEINIRNTVTPREMETFVDVIKDEVRSFSQDEDIVTKLWKADFQHISYRILDEYLVGQFGEGCLGESESNLCAVEIEDHPDAPSFEDKGRVILTAKEAIESLDSYIAQFIKRGTAGLSEEQREGHIQDMMESMFNVSSDELRQCHEEIFKFKKSDSLVAFVTEYLDFTLMDDNPSAVRDVMSILDCLIDFIVSELHCPTLHATLTGIRSFKENVELADDKKTYFDTLDKMLTNTSVLVSLAETAENSDEDCENVFAYFELVGEKTVPTICKLLEDQSEPAIHRRGREALVRISGHNLTDLIGKMNIDKPQVARDVVRLLRVAGVEEVPDVIKELMYYPDDHVRYEVIQLLARLANDEAAELLMKLLDDGEKNIRLRTISAISDTRHPAIRGRLEQIAFGKELSQRDSDEQSELYKALGQIAGGDIVAKLEQTTGRRNFFGFGKRQNRENKLLAICALERISNANAEALLERLAKDSDTDVADRAQQALQARVGSDSSDVDAESKQDRV